jgi:hypothetical protein
MSTYCSIVEVTLNKQSSSQSEAVPFLCRSVVCSQLSRLPLQFAPSIFLFRIKKRILLALVLERLLTMSKLQYFPNQQRNDVIRQIGSACFMISLLRAPWHACCVSHNCILRVSVIR